MTQKERREYLITELLKEKSDYADVEIPADERGQRDLLRALMNLREPLPISDEFLKIQDEYLQQAIREKGVTRLETLAPLEDGLYLWQGDITTLRIDAIVNAANSGMTGCYFPCHGCIDNCIHTYAGIQLRNYCNDLMVQQGHEEPVGRAKITPGFNLPAEHVIHTVGPRVVGPLTDEYKEQLKSCYVSCLALADENKLESIAFCCISTGEFMFPYKKAAEIAVNTVKEYKERTGSRIKVVFDVFSQQDWVAYKALLS